MARGRCGSLPRGYRKPARLQAAPPLASRLNPLADFIRDEIARHGPMPFARFMELALYHPELGYYERGPRPIGRRGDFFTSVSVGPLFGQLLAGQFAEWLVECGTRTAEFGMAESESGAQLQILEAGAHDGQLATDVLDWFQRQRPELFERLEYVILEPSPRRRRWQRETLTPFACRVRWLDGLSAPHDNPPSATRHPHFTGVLFSNELLDAFPVHRLGWDAHEHEWFEWAVERRGDRFDWARLPLAPDAALLDPQSAISNTRLQQVLPDGFTVEVCPAAEAWWRTAAASLRSGWLLTLDYGLTDDESPRPERLHGTLRAFRDHQVSADVLAAPGEQDITAHVSFSALQRAGESCGLRTMALESQAAFLTRALDHAQRASSASLEWTVALSRQFQTLTHAEHLGGKFRVLVQRR